MGLAVLKKKSGVMWVKGSWVGNFKLILCSNGSISCLEIITRNRYWSDLIVLWTPGLWVQLF